MHVALEVTILPNFPRTSVKRTEYFKCHEWKRALGSTTIIHMCLEAKGPCLL
jgi:hypothetical protein